MQATDKKRARSDVEKFQRRQQILDAAEAHLGDTGYEAFSMARLAKLAGVAKGTLYLYFTSREEVLLALYCTQLERFDIDLRKRLASNMPDDAFIQAFYDAALNDRGFLTLSLRLNHVIENNVSTEALINAKRTMRSLIEHTSSAIAAALNLTVAQALDLTSALASLLIGTARGDEGPDLDTEDIPEDVRQFIDAFHNETTFLKNARRILAGIRAGL